MSTSVINPSYVSVWPYTALTDWEGVKATYQECFPYPFTVPMLDHHLQDSLITGGVWVATLNEQIVGYILLEEKNRSLYLSQVGVRSCARNHGIATALIGRAEAEVVQRGRHKWWLEVKTNNPAQKLYFDLGFRVSGFSPNLYGEGDHGMSMTKLLK